MALATQVNADTCTRVHGVGWDWQPPLQHGRRCVGLGLPPSMIVTGVHAQTIVDNLGDYNSEFSHQVHYLQHILAFLLSRATSWFLSVAAGMDVFLREFPSVDARNSC